ncbi:MAG TPA: polysaccharide biosynthesis/export family protein [Tepidisphaeraceae bacterium]|jgi:anti-sigma factor RsiW|nr:polysaccharide biosynthesis/export family protein [Tepidisphaeraceae bacterium]
MSNPNQEIIESRLATYIDGELEDNERLEIEQHLQQNPQYRKVIEDLRKQRDMLRGLPREAAPLDIAEAFTNQLERAELLDSHVGPGDRRPMRINALPRLMAAAAIVLLTLGLGVIVYIVLPDRNVQKYSVAPLGNKSIFPATTAPADETLDDRSDPSTPDDRVLAKGNEPKTTIPDSLRPATDNALAIPGHSANADDRKNAAHDGMEYAALKSQVQSLARHEPGDLELDRVAESVSKDPQVKALLAQDFDENRSAALGALPAEKARVMVVRASDPKQVEAELTTLFGRENVDWRPAPKPLELALNTSLSQQSDESLQSNGARNKREIDSKAIESEKLAELNDHDAIAKGVGPKPGTIFAAPRQGQKEQQGQGQTALGHVSEKSSANNPAALADAADSKRKREEGDAGAQASEGMSLASGATLGEQEKLRAGPAKGQAFAANPAPVQTLFVARRLSPAQVAALNACLAQNAEPTKANANRRLGEYRIGDYRIAAGVPAPLEGAAGTNAAAPVAAAARPTSPAPPASFAVRDSIRNQAPGAGSGGSADHAPAGTAQGADATAAVPGPAPAATPPTATSLTAAATRPDSVVRKGDQLRVQFGNRGSGAEQSQTVKVKEDGTISPQGKPVQVAGKTLDEVKKAIAQSEPSSIGGGRGTAAPSDVNVERVAPAFGYDKDRAAASEPALGSAEKQARSSRDSFGADLQRRASVNGAANAPATQPAPDAGSVDEAVDVVIVIQQQPGVVDTIAAPIPAPADKPAAAITSPVSPAPSSRPSTPGK